MVILREKNSIARNLPIEMKRALRRLRQRIDAPAWFYDSLAGKGQSSHSAMPRPMIHSLSVAERKSSSSVKSVTACL
jgi:hypothetical protein